MKGRLGRLGIMAFLGLFVFSGCIYYNTFYLARKSYSKAEKAQKKSGREVADGASSSDYQNAIKWASRVLTFHPKSGWVDDALMLIGRSHYNMGEYRKARGKFEELLTGFPDSKFTPQSRLYLARSILKTGNYEEARDLALQSIPLVKSKEIKGELTVVAGESYFALGDYPSAISHYQQVLEYPVSKETRAYVLHKKGTAFFQREKYVEAYEAYLEALKNSPADGLEYNLTLSAIECTYKIGRVSEGIALATRLSKDARFAQNQGDLKIKIAQGYILQDSTGQALELLTKMTKDFIRQEAASRAYLEMGKVYQEKMGDLKKAKENYDLATKEGQTASVLQEALARSGEITRFEGFQKELALVPDSSADSGKPDSGKVDSSKIDSSRTAHAAVTADSAKLANSWFLLAEVYRLSLKKPDSALWAYQTIFEKFPQTATAPQAMLAYAQTKSETFGDSAAADSIYRMLLNVYPHSDYAKEAIRHLGLAGTAADSGYPEAVFLQAEKTWESGNVDSAKVLFSQIPERFPNSEYAPKSLFTLAALYEAYGNAGSDSAAFLAYREVVKKYPESEYGRKAKEKVGLAPPEVKKPDTLAFQPVAQPPDSVRKADSLKALTALDSLRLFERFQTQLAPPVKKNGGFVYPASEIDANIKTKLVFKVFLDYEGKVKRALLQNPSESDVINREAQRAVELTEFDMVRVDPSQYNSYFIFKLEVAPKSSDPNAPPGFR